jgi:hypothetical protein
MTDKLWLLLKEWANEHSLFSFREVCACFQTPKVCLQTFNLSDSTSTLLWNLMKLSSHIAYGILDFFPNSEVYSKQVSTEF